MKEMPKLFSHRLPTTKYEFHSYGNGRMFWVYMTEDHSHKSLTTEEFDLIIQRRIRVVKEDIASLKKTLGYE